MKIFHSLKKIKKLRSIYFYYFKNFYKEVAPPPKSINVEITHKCNLNCIMCNRRLGIDNKDLSFDNFVKIINNFQKLELIGFMGLGEVFMNPDFLNMLNECDKRGIDTMFTTNAMLLTESKIKSLPKNVKEIFVSIDSLDRELYKKIRINSDLDIVIKNLKNLRKLRPEIKLTVQTLILKSNLKELQDFVKFAHELKADLNFIIPSVGLKEIEDQHPHLYIKEFSKYLALAENEAKKLNVRLFSRPKQPEMNPSYVFCNEPWRCPYIALNGNVFPCCFAYRTPEPKAPIPEYYCGLKIDFPAENYVMGNIFEQDFEKIWNNKKYRELRRVVRNTFVNKKLSPEELNEIRKTVKGGFDYCRVCLWRWGCAC
jgi:MoaA/NifB/PqqE/SkfB family radical SAM enzyme